MCNNAYMNKSRRDDDTRSKLLEKGKREGEVLSYGLLQEQGPEHAEGAGSHNDEQETDAEANVVAALGGVTLGGAFIFVAADTVSADVSMRCRMPRIGVELTLHRRESGSVRCHPRRCGRGPGWGCGCDRRRALRWGFQQGPRRHPVRYNIWLLVSVWFSNGSKRRNAQVCAVVMTAGEAGGQICGRRGRSMDEIFRITIHAIPSSC